MPEHTSRWYVYVLRCDDDSLYTGATNNLGKRMAAHRSGKGSKYVRSRLPFEVVATWPCIPDSRSHALRVEARFKKLKKAEKEEIVSNSEPWVGVYEVHIRGSA